MTPRFFIFWALVCVKGNLSFWHEDESILLSPADFTNELRYVMKEHEIDLFSPFIRNAQYN